MTKAPWKSAFVAALFALHPLHVESVAWVAERKDVLSTFFWMLTMVAYCYYVERPCLRRYMSVLFFFILGLMAKPMLVTLPFVLLLLDYWPLGRFELEGSDQEILKQPSETVPTDAGKSVLVRSNTTTEKASVEPEGARASVYRWQIIRPLLLEKIPPFMLALVSSVITIIAQQEGGATQAAKAWPLLVRISNAFLSYMSYIAMAMLPNNLAIFYPCPQLLMLWKVVISILGFISITVLVFVLAKKCRYVIVGWLWYIVTLLPVIGLIQVSSQARADRYTYIPLVGLFIIVAWGIPQLLERWVHWKAALMVLSALALSCFFFITWAQVGYWLNSFTLFDHALQVTNNNYVIYYNRGNAYRVIGNPRRAIMDYDRAIEIFPEYVEAYINRGIAHAALGKEKEAIGDCDRAIGIDPGNALAHYDRALLYAKLGQNGRAIEDLKTAAKLGYQEAKNLLKSQGISW